MIYVTDYPDIIRDRSKVMKKIFNPKKTEPYAPLQAAKKLAVEEFLFDYNDEVEEADEGSTSNEMSAKAIAFLNCSPVVVVYANDINDESKNERYDLICNAICYCFDSQSSYVMLYDMDGRYRLHLGATNKLDVIDNLCALQDQIDVIQNMDTDGLLAEYDDLKNSIEFAKERINEITETLILKCTDDVTVFPSGHKLTKIKRKGSIDYKKIASEYQPDDLDVEQYRKPDSEFWKLC